MKKILLFFCLLLSVLLVSCDQYRDFRLDGMWQLKTVEDVDGNIVQIDTVYYSFQREAVFSYTVLENLKYAMPPVYGYVDMPSDNEVHVLIDSRSGSRSGSLEWFLGLSGWSSHDVIFEIKKYNNTDLVLFDEGNGKTYTFKKF